MSQFFFFPVQNSKKNSIIHGSITVIEKFIFCKVDFKLPKIDFFIFVLLNLPTKNFFCIRFLISITFFNVYQIIKFNWNKILIVKSEYFIGFRKKKLLSTIIIIKKLFYEKSLPIFALFGIVTDKYRRIKMNIYCILSAS